MLNVKVLRMILDRLSKAKITLFVVKRIQHHLNSQFFFHLTLAHRVLNLMSSLKDFEKHMFIHANTFLL